MTRKALHTWFFPVLSLAVGLGQMLWFGVEFPFMGLLMGPPDTNAFLAAQLVLRSYNPGEA
jgi:hypothetical protein